MGDEPDPASPFPAAYGNYSGAFILSSTGIHRLQRLGGQPGHPAALVEFDHVILPDGAPGQHHREHLIGAVDAFVRPTQRPRCHQCDPDHDALFKPAHAAAGGQRPAAGAGRAAGQGVGARVARGPMPAIPVRPLG
jgi:hypothetical protein